VGLPVITADVDQRAAFLGALHDGCAGMLELRAFTRQKGAPLAGRLFCAPPDTIAITSFVDAHREHDVYFGVATRADASSGALENCCQLRALFADIDFKVTPEDVARDRLARFALAPSIVIHSGGGLHGYWLLLASLALPADGPKAKVLLRRLAHALTADLAAAEPARVLRVPGTLNQKPDYRTPRTVAVEHLDADRRYDVAEFERVLPAEPAAESAGAFTMPGQPLAEGEGRNTTLYKLIRSLVARKLNAQSIVAAVEAENARFRPPLADAELHALLQHALTQPDRAAFAGRNGQAALDQPATDEDPRPEIDIANLGLDEMAMAAWKAIEATNTPPRVFLSAGGLAWLVADATGLPTVEVMSQDHIRHRLADVVSFIRWSSAGRERPPKKKPAFPPETLAADLRAVPHPTLPRLERIVRMPVFTQDGRLLTAPGYDAASGLYLAPPAGLTLPPIPSAPSGTEIAAAREALCVDLLGDFPFVTDADLAHAVALLFTPVLRELVTGCVPLFVLSKPTPRTGAGLLTKAVSIVQGGSPIAATTISRDEEEMRKRLTSLLMSSPAMILLDNLHGRLDSAALAAILTTPTWEDRLLGRSQTVRLTVRSVFVATGNNVALSNEMAGRSVLIRLDPKIEDPSTRTGFQHADLERWATTNRARLLWAALVLGQAWVTAGRPLAAIAFGGFAEWAGVLGGVLQIAGIPGFLANRRTLFEQADEESAHVRAFLADWWTAHGDTPVLVKALIELAKGHPLPIASRSEQGTLIRLGQLIQSLEDRRYDLGGCGVAVRRAGAAKRAVLWRLVGESNESDESPSVNTRARSAAQPPEGLAAGKDSPDSHTHQQRELRI
jgi:hypothetical protein